tara:strand:- start:1168 stop:1539 length:372 start_codon:yes stop_codon:yes gene_type:complete
MSVANRFTSVPAVPQGGFTDYQTVLIGAVKENIELLTGLRGETDVVSKAITQGQVTVNQMGQQKMQQVTAKGDGSTITISGTAYDLANLSDVRKLIVDVQTLAGDVAEMRATLNFLIKQMRGR